MLKIGKGLPEEIMSEPRLQRQAKVKQVKQVQSTEQGGGGWASGAHSPGKANGCRLPRAWEGLA